MSTSVKIRPDQLGAALEHSGKTHKGATYKAAIASARKFRALLVARTDELGITDRGQLKNSWKAEKTEYGAIVFTDCPYAGIIELGARPHPVSLEGIEMIASWVERKLGFRYGPVRQQVHGPTGKVSKKGPGKQTFKINWETGKDEAMEIARAIAHNIKLYGQKPKYLVAGVLDKASEYYHEELDRIMHDEPPYRGQS